MSTKRIALAAACLMALSGIALAQQPPAAAQGSATSAASPRGMMDGGMMGDRMWGHGMHEGGMMMGRRYCQSNDAMAPKILGRLENTIKPTEAQKPEMDALRAAATKAEAIIRAACPAAGADDRSPPARLAQMEKNATAMADALKIVRPSFDALYAKLDDKQRDRMRWSRGRH